MSQGTFVKFRELGDEFDVVLGNNFHGFIQFISELSAQCIANKPYAQQLQFKFTWYDTYVTCA